MRQAALVGAVLVTAGCGGGGGGNVRDMEDVPGAVPWTQNPTALDIGEHWNETATIVAAAGFAQGAANTTGLEAAQGAATEASSESITWLRNVGADRIETVGTRDGITLAHWKGGPAGTLDIDFDWSSAPHLSSAERAIVERAAREWSRRIATNFGPHTADAGTIIDHHSSTSGRTPLVATIRQDTPVDDILIVMLDAGDVKFSSGGVRQYERVGEVIDPWLGSIALSRNHIGDQRIAAHEVGHVLDRIWAESERPSQLGSYIDRTNHVFTGPEAMRVNGGEPVPFQWVDANNDEVPPNTPGGVPDYGHLGVCTSLMAYCTDRSTVSGPQPIDFAILKDSGYTLLDAATAAENEVYGFGAWGSYSAWGAGVERRLDHERNRDHTRAVADAFGTAPANNFADTVGGLTGIATWTGNLIGVDRARADFPPVVGDATIDIEFATLAGEARFENLTTVRDGAASTFRHASLTYDVNLDGNSFSDTAGHIEGSLHGPGHEEMAGILDDDTPGVGVLGGFGGVRELR